MIQSTIIESLENVVLGKFSSQPKSTYEAAVSLTEFELKKILLDKMQKSKSYRAAQEYRDLYDVVVKSYKLDNDLFESYGKAYSLNRDHEDKDKDEDPLAGSDQGLKRRKTSKDSTQAEESVFETADTEMLHNQGSNLGNIDDQPNVEAASKPDEDQQLYKFKEGDFPRLNLRDIEDMLLLLVQKKLSNMERDVIFDLNMALRMFIRHVVILKRVEDLQLGVKSYQSKLNINERAEDIQYKRNMLKRSDELYKFTDGTLTSVRTVLYDIASNLKMDYLPKRKWSNLDRQRSRIMIKAIDKLQLERRLMRNSEKFVGWREYREDFRLLERII
ncbi:hypothetical protein Tco_0168237 [Tanacetum coccineum]